MCVCVSLGVRFSLCTHHSFSLSRRGCVRLVYDSWDPRGEATPPGKKSKEEKQKSNETQNEPGKPALSHSVGTSLRQRLGGRRHDLHQRACAMVGSAFWAFTSLNGCAGALPSVTLLNEFPFSTHTKVTSPLFFLSSYFSQALARPHDSKSETHTRGRSYCWI